LMFRVQGGVRGSLAVEILDEGVEEVNAEKRYPHPARQPEHSAGRPIVEADDSRAAHDGSRDRRDGMRG